MFRRVSRDLASLGTNAHEQRYKKSSQKRGSYTFVHSSASAPLTKPIDPPTTPIARPTPDATSVPLTHREDDSRLTGSAAADQRTAIKYFYENVLGSPPAHTWKAEGTITIILHHLCMPPGSWGTVRKVLLALVSDPESDVRAEAPGKGRGALIEEPSEQADVIYALLEAGNSVATVTYLLNQGYRASRGLDHICYSAVDRFVRSSPVIHRARRHMKKSGKDDAGTPWAAARLAFSLQLLEQLAGTGSRWPSLHLHAIVWWDEHHKKVILGHTSVHEYRVRRDSAGKPAPAAAGGVLPPAKPNTSMKYPGEARGLFGVAKVRKADGSYVGVKAEPFNYTGMQVVGIAQFKRECEAEKLRAASLPVRPHIYTDAELIAKMRSLKRICITELIDHAITQSDAIYAGTEWELTYMLFHDGLTAWWEPEAQAYLASRGFAHRQLRCLDPTNASGPAKRYRNKLPGDSPEMARALDSYGFAHLSRSLKLHTSLTSVLPVDHPQRFKMGTPKEVWSSLQRVWTVAPTSAQIVADIDAFPAVLQKIVEFAGCVVPDENFRGGRRERRADGSGDLTTRMKKRQRKETQMHLDLHPDCAPALQILHAGGIRMVEEEEEAEEEDEGMPAADDAAMAPVLHDDE